MAAGDETNSRRSQREDRHATHARSHRDHTDRREDATTSSRSRSHRGRDDSHRRRSRSRSASPRRADSCEGGHGLHPTLLKFGVGELSEHDYFIRAVEFKAWLCESKGKYLDEISSKDARRYFDRFVRRWNEATLPDEYYRGKIRSSTAAAGSSSQTRHRWAFTGKATYSSAEQEQLAMIRDNVDTLTNGDSRGAIEARHAERRARTRRSGHVDVEADEAPSRDSGWNSRTRAEAATSSNRRGYAETQLEREHRQDMTRVAQSESRRRERHDRADEEESLQGRATGRDRMLEKKRERAAVNREFANRRNADDGIEMDERELYDQDALARPSSSTSGAHGGRGGMSKTEQARQQKMEERQAEMQHKVSALRQKDRETMEMFKAMAQERFGSSS